MTPAVVIGQSHSAAIAQALEDDQKHAAAISVHRLESKNRPFERNVISVEDAIAIAEAVPSDGAVFLAMLGTAHNYFGMLRSGPDFDFLLAADDVPDRDGTTRIPHRALTMAFDESRNQGPTIEKIRAASTAAVFLLSSPPPKQSNDYIFHRFMGQSARQYYGKNLQEVGVERPESRLKLWSLESRLSARWAESKGIQFVPAPAKCFNADGFLSRKYYFEDATHANARYGVLVVEQICGILENMRKQAAHG
jgi:hypothetical protein